MFCFAQKKKKKKKKKGEKKKGVALSFFLAKVHETNAFFPLDMINTHEWKYTFLGLGHSNGFQFHLALTQQRIVVEYVSIAWMHSHVALDVSGILHASAAPCIS